MHDIVLQLLNGLVVGSSLALVASGLALVFGVLDIVNFAQGELFMLGGYTLFFTLQATGNFLLGVIAAAVIVGIAGGAILYGMVWPLLGRSTALPLLATLGLSLILQQLATNVFNSTTRSVPAPVPWRIPVENIDYPVYNLLIIVISGAILAAGYVFLKSTRYGIWLRAVAENRPMAAALGVPVPRVYFLAFVLSAGLAGIAGALLAPVVSVYTTVGSDVILNAFIVVVAGGMGNFRGAALVALLLGEVEAVGSIWFRPVEVQVFALFLVIAILVYRSRGKPAAVFTRAAATARGATARLSRRTYAALSAILLLLALVLPLVTENVSQRIGIYLIYGLLGISVALITGFGRLFNIGVGAIFGLSAYTVAFLTNHNTTNPLVLLIAAVAAALVMAALFGVYTNVASGIEYMMLTFLTTLAMGAIPSVAPQITGGDNGLQVKGGLVPSFGLNPLLGNAFYYFIVAVILVCVAACWYILSSQFGRVAQAIGRNPARAAAMGYRVSQQRMVLTLLAGFLAAIAGWLYALDNSFVSQDLLGLNNSLNGLLYALVGGAEHVILGPLVGAAGMRYLTDSLGRLTSQSALYIGLALLVVVYLMPNGILGLVDQAIRQVARRSTRGESTELPPIPSVANIQKGLNNG
ncbi:MAG: ABC transporter permease [Chloroflexi bacterium]|nr:ABC transporter permease [Chloroflexota bacterium]